MIDARRQQNGNGNFVEMEMGFSFQPRLERKKLKHPNVELSVCSGKFAFDARLSSTFQPASKPKSFKAKWNGAPVITTSQALPINRNEVNSVRV